MECDSGFSFLTSSDGLWEGVAPNPKADAEKILQEAQQQDKPVDEDGAKVKVDSAFRMEGGGYVCQRLYIIYTRYQWGRLFHLA